MTQEDLILIENYLKGILSDNEKKAFLERLDSDSEFNKEFRIEEHLYLTLNKRRWSFVEKGTPEVLEYETKLKSEKTQRLKQTLSNLSSEFNQPSKKRIKVYYYLAAASIVAFLGFQLFFNQGISHQELYNTYSNLNDLPSFVTRDSNNELDQKLIEGEMYFDSGKYQNALDVFEPILESNKTNSLLYIYIGAAQTELGLYKESEKTFNNLMANNNQDAQIANWHKALIYLKMKDDKKTLEQLKIITKDTENYNYKEAIELIEKIEE